MSTKATGNKKHLTLADRAAIEHGISRGEKMCIRDRSREVCELAAKKSRYCLQDTRTVNRHRWMRRES